MFDVTEYRVIPSDPKSLEGIIPGAVYQSSMVQLAPMMPMVWQGRAQQASYFMQPSVWVRMSPAPNGTSVEIRMGVEIDSTGWIVYILMLLFFWPAAAIVGYLGYDDFQKKRMMMMHAMWQALGASPVQGGPPSPYGVGGGPPGPPPGGFSGQYG